LLGLIVTLEVVTWDTPDVGPPEPGVGIGPMKKEDRLPPLAVVLGLAVDALLDAGTDGPPEPELGCGRGGTTGKGLVEETPGYEADGETGLELIVTPGTVTEDAPGPGI
jgi:hypothetical protein